MSAISDPGQEDHLRGRRVVQSLLRFGLVGDLPLGHLLGGFANYTATASRIYAFSGPAPGRAQQTHPMGVSMVAASLIATVRPEIAQRPDQVRSCGVSTTDVLKFVGVLVLLIDHYGIYFDPYEGWWRVVGRVAAPIFFYLIGFARTRSIPWTWIAYGAALTILDVLTSWKSDGLRDITVDILIHFAVLRFAVLPFVEGVVLRRTFSPWLAVGCMLLIPVSEHFLEYGIQGWLWAFLGLSHRIALGSSHPARRWVCLAVALLAAGAYLVHEIQHHDMDGAESIVLTALIVCLTGVLLTFRRTVLEVQPPAAVARLFQFCGRYSLEIYAITLFAMRVIAYALEPGVAIGDIAATADLD